MNRTLKVLLLVLSLLLIAGTAMADPKPPTTTPYIVEPTE